MFPTSVQGMIGQVMSQLPVSAFNLVCTNVPGPQFPLYLMGHKMLHCYPYVPVGGEMAVNCAILSYNGMAYFGFSGDVHAAPDLRRLEKLLQESFTELRNAAGIIKPPTKKNSQRQRASKATFSKPRQAARAVAEVQAASRPQAVTSAVLIPIPSKQAPEPAPVRETESAAAELVVA